MTQPLPGPLTAPPTPDDPYVADEAAQQMLESAVAGLDLGEYDRRVLAWVAGRDYPTIATVASIIWRARLAGHESNENGEQP